MREVTLENGEYYHIFNRGVDKRQIVMDLNDTERFLLSLHEFNTTVPIGSLYQHSFRKSKPTPAELSNSVTKLVEITAYCLNPNHYHFILHQIVNGGISKFMHKLGLGYTRYFNERYKRSGSLFQGKFKAVHIETSEQLLHVSAYVNLNNRVHHKFSGRTSQLVCSSWDEYRDRTTPTLCEKGVVLGQFRSRSDYARFAKETIKEIAKRREKIEDDDITLAGTFEEE
jgi:REP element-mobilizing transposase RayT